MKRVFLVDYENTAVRGLFGISELGFGDKVVVFCSNENIKRAIYDLLKVYEERGVKIRVHLLKKRATNALDFMITTYLGFEVSMDEKKEIFVISADKGYESAIDMAHELSNGVFIGFHESIYESIHEKYTKSLPGEDDDVLAIDAKKSHAIECEQKKQLDGKAYKALLGPVQEKNDFEYKKGVSQKEKKRGFGSFILGSKKAKPATNRQRDEYRRRFMEQMNRDGKIPSQYTNQLTAFMDKCKSKTEFVERASIALGNKNKELLDVAERYFDEYDKNRP